MAEIRLGEALTAKRDAEAVKLVERVGQGGIEMAAKPPHIGLGHLPNTEKAENMVDTIGIEAVLHLAEALAPPCVAVLGHLIPIVGRETPILAAQREVIGGRTRRGVAVEQLGRRLDIDGIGSHADRDIALDRHTDRMGVGYRLLQLAIGVVLQIGVVGGVFAVVRRPIERIAVEPKSIVGQEALVVLRGEQ